MPPKSKFTRDEIIDAAVEIVRKKGLQVLTARELANVLDSSPRPIFTLFRNMEEVTDEVIKRAKQLYHSYVEEGLHSEKPFRSVGEKYIQFAVQEPELFQILFLQTESEALDLDHILHMLDADYEAILESVENHYPMQREKAKRLYQHMWIYTHGIAVLSASNMIVFKDHEIRDLLTEVFIGLLKREM